MIEGKTVTGVILVAGNSTRYGKNRNKNFEIINGETVLSYSLKAFEKNTYIDTIIIGAKSMSKFLANVCSPSLVDAVKEEHP